VWSDEAVIARESDEDGERLGSRGGGSGRCGRMGPSQMSNRDCSARSVEVVWFLGAKSWSAIGMFRWSPSSVTIPSIFNAALSKNDARIVA
jgi:hypothetical protein